VESTKFESVCTQVGAGASRRQAVTALAALALGSAGILGFSQSAAADQRRRCIERCNDHQAGGDTDRERRKRCRRRCEDR
jgi:hypothetical protein